MDIADWLTELLTPLRISVDMRISVGFSFIGQKSNRLTYFFAAKELCTINGVFRKKTSALDFAKSLKRPHHGFLEETFLSTESGEPFSLSGIRPHSLIACYIWITK